MIGGRVVLTHSEGRLEALPSVLEACGLRVVRAPLVSTRARPGARPEAAALLALPWLLFASRAAVEAWVALELPVPRPGRGPRLGAVGAATAAALRRLGAEVAAVGQPATAAGLSAAFARHPDAAGPVGLPRGTRSRRDLEEALAEAGYATRGVTVYETATLPWGVDGAVDAVVLASPSAVRALPAGVARSAALVALGATTGAAVRARGFACTVAAGPAAQQVAEATERALRRRSGASPEGPREGGPA